MNEFNQFNQLDDHSHGDDSVSTDDSTSSLSTEGDPDSTQEERRRNNKMRKIVYGLMVVAIAVVAVACTAIPSAQEGSGNRQPDNNVITLKAGDVSSGKLLGMNVQYSVKETVQSPVSGVEIDGWYEWTGDYCNIDLTVERANSIRPSELARMVAYCFNWGPMDIKYEDYDEAEVFYERWAQKYVSSCGERFEPLSWFNIKDGACVLPTYNLDV